MAAWFETRGIAAVLTTGPTISSLSKRASAGSMDESHSAGNALA